MLTGTHEYRRPCFQSIGRGPTTEKLYALEEARSRALEAAAREWMRIIRVRPNGEGLEYASASCVEEGGGWRKLREDEFWTVAIPQALLDFLDSWDPHASLLAARAYIDWCALRATRKLAESHPTADEAR